MARAVPCTLPAMLRTRLLAVVGCLVTTVATGAAPAPSGLSPTERRLVRLVGQRGDEATALLEQLVEINSGTMNFDGVRRVGGILRRQLDELGFSTRWIDGSGFDRAGHLVAEHPGSGAGPRLLLIGHLDTVFEPDSPFQRFERLDVEHARGPGTIDMKGGLVVMLEALRALRAVGALDRMTITIFLAGDEEKPGRPLAESRRALVTAARAADVALGFEDGDGDPETAVIARRGSTEWLLQVSGTPAHSSQLFQAEVGAGAIYETARILEGFRQRLSGERHLTFNPGTIVGGTEVEFDRARNRGSAFGKTNVVAQRAVVAGDLRPVTPAQLERAQEAMREVAAASLPGTAAELTFWEDYPPMAPSPGNRALLALYDAVSRDLGHGPVAPVDPRNAGAADVAFAAAHVERALDGIGLMGTGGHTVKETADLTTLRMQAERAAVLLLRLHRQGNGTVSPSR